MLTLTSSREIRIFQQMPYELVLDIFHIHEGMTHIKDILRLRLVCKIFDEKIIATINSNTIWLTKFYNFIQKKERDSILKKEAFLLNRLPNLRTHIPFEANDIYIFLFYQDFSFCKTDEEYKALYNNKEKTAIQGLLLFDQESEKGSFELNTGFKYGWFNHGIGYKTSRECNFCHIGFLFFDFHFYPPLSFWKKPYNKDTINPINVLISLSFNNFFNKALQNFVEKIPKEHAEEIIYPVMIMNPPPMFLGQDFECYFKNFTKPLFEDKLKFNFFKKSKSLLYLRKGLMSISIGIVLITIIYTIKTYIIRSIDKF